MVEVKEVVQLCLSRLIKIQRGVPERVLSGFVISTPLVPVFVRMLEPRLFAFLPDKQAAIRPVVTDKRLVTMRDRLKGRLFGFRDMRFKLEPVLGTDVS